MRIKIKTALVSVSNKTGLEELVSCLTKHNINIISTGGTAKFIKDLGVEVTDVSSLTNFPEMMDGRLKTLHPNIHGGLLAKRDDETHKSDQQDHQIKDAYKKEILNALKSQEKRQSPSLDQLVSDVYQSAPKYLQEQYSDLLAHIDKYPDHYLPNPIKAQDNSYKNSVRVSSL